VAVLNTNEAQWKTYGFDVREYVGESLYVFIEGNGNYSYDEYFDDFRMVSDGGASVVVGAYSRGTWTGIPGDHTITVTVDSGGEVAEVAEDNNVSAETFNVPEPDLTISSLTYSPLVDLEGRTSLFTAVVSNAGTGGVTDDFNLRW